MNRIKRGLLPALFLFMVQPAMAQIVGEAVPSRQFTWNQLLAQEEKAVLEGRAPIPTQPPDHGRITTHFIDSPSIQKNDLLEKYRPGSVLPLANCNGFSAWPSHSGAFGFQGLADDGTSIPPDTMGAVGPRHVMTMLNTQVRIQDRSGSLMYSTVSISTFWAGLNGPFDPKIYYDNLSGRWIAVCLGNQSSANSDWEIIISSTNDPTGLWTSYHLDGDATNSRWVDFPCVGFNDKWVAATFNAFNVDGTPGRSPKMWVFNKPQLLAGGEVGFIEYDVNFDGGSGFTLQPAVCMEPNVADLYILDYSGLVGASKPNLNWLRLSRITGTAESPLWSAMPGSNTTVPGAFAVQNRFSNTMMPAAQKDSPTGLDSGDTRMRNVVYRNGHIWSVHGGGYPADTPDRNALYWYELQPLLPNPIVQSGIIETGGPNAHYTYPSIAVNCGNDACIGFSAVSPAIYGSACYVTRLSNDPLGTTSPSQYFKDGRAKYVRIDPRNGRNRWGDYSATVIDPLDDKTFWTLQEYAELPFVGGIDRWAVQWAQVTQDCQTPAITQHPQSQDICLGQPVTFSVGATGDVAQYQWYKNGQPIIGATFYDYTIPSIVNDDAGQYSCTVIGLCSTVSTVSATLSILTAPVVTGFVAWPNATCPGDIASIIPAVPDSGAFPMTVTLQKYNGSWQDVPGRTIAYGDAFLFSPLMHEDTGDYRLKYTNACGNGFTSQHRIQVGVSFDASPAAVSELPCGEANFVVVARGIGTLTYQWRHDGVSLVDDDRLSGADSSLLLIDKLLYVDEGSYDCQVTDICETRPSNVAKLTLPTPIWVHRVTDQPIKRSSTAMAYDSNRQVTVLYGGYGPNGLLNDTWEWDGTNWTQRTLPLTPGYKYSHSMTYDSDRKVIVLYGGFSGSGFQSDLWEFDGQTWTLRAPSNAVGGPPSFVASLSPIAYDSVRYKIVMVRNNVSGATANTETWEFDQPTSHWNLRVASNNFPGGFGDVVGFDPIRNVSVHYYASASYDGYKASHRWNGSIWTPDPPTTANMAWTNIAYDTTRRRLVLFGGTPGSNLYQTDSFFDTGNGWAVLLQAGPPSSPPIYTSLPSAMAYDSHRRAMISVLNPYYGDYYGPLETWEYRYLDRVVFDRHPKSQLLAPGGDANFTVDAAGYGLLSYIWQRNGQIITDGASPGGGTFVGATTSTLTIQNIDEPDGGIYTCTVTNSCGSETSAAALLSTSPVDFNADGVVDLMDFAFLEGCIIGPGGVPLDIGCEIADANGDGRVDFLDFALFQVLFNGAG